MKQTSSIANTIINYALTVAVFFLASCNTHQEELANSNSQRDSLIAILMERDSTVNDFLESYTEIQQNLDSVALHGTTISKNMANQTELKSTSRQRINNDIMAINTLMKENREKISSLNRKLKKSGNKNVQLEKLIQTLNDQLVIKDCELDVLNQRLVALNEDVIMLQTFIDTMTAQNTKQSIFLNSELHTAYYIIGKAKDLKSKKVIDKEGGLLGMGKTSTLNANFDSNYFTQIDYTQVSSIPINSKDSKMITTHPSNSYSLDRDANKLITLRITDAAKFWSASKYLVIVND